MKKRFLAIVLTLALCVGITVPVFAAEEPAYDFGVGVPSGYTPTKKLATYQIREFQQENATRYAYKNTPESVDIAPMALPLETDIVVSGMRTSGNMLLDVVMIAAWSDPDRDGIYDHRAFSHSAEDDSATLIPLTGSNSFALAQGAECSTAVRAGQLGFYTLSDESGHTFLHMNTNRLCEIFGANTILSIAVYGVENNQLEDTYRANSMILLTGETYTAPSRFTDVKSTDYFADAVNWAVDNKITSGTSNTTFSPGNTCSRAQVLSFLWRASGSPESKTGNPFDDIKSTDYFYKAALWAAEKGMVSGPTFGASTPCTRASTMEYMWKAAGSPTVSYDGRFSDVSTDADNAQAIAWAVKNNVTAGTSKTTFGPDNTCTRGQIVSFLYRYFAK